MSDMNVKRFVDEDWLCQCGYTHIRPHPGMRCQCGRKYDPQDTDCLAIGVGGMHSDEYLEGDGCCQFCGKKDTHE